MLNNFIYAQSKAMFEERIAEVPNDAIVFIEDTKEIWTHGTYFDCSTLDPSIIPNLQMEIDELRMAFNNKADVDGSYPDMTVGFAEDLGGAEFTQESEFTIRATADGEIVKDGAARIESLKGNSLVWNQWSKQEVGVYGDSNRRWTRAKSGVTDLIYNNGTFRIVVEDTTQQCPMIRSKEYAFPSNHKMFVSYDAYVSGNINGESKVYLGYFSSPTQWLEELPLSSLIGKKTRTSKIVTLTNEAQSLFLGIYASLPVGTILEYSNIEVCDLTQMFGAGNEPTTIEEFYARIPMGVDLNAYNAGEVISMKASGIKSVGVNVWDEQWEIGGMSTDTGASNSNIDQIRTKSAFPIIGGKTYYIKNPAAVWAFFYNREMELITCSVGSSTSGYASLLYNTTFTPPADARYMKFYVVNTYGTTYKDDICINLSNSEVDGKYFPHEEVSEDLSLVAKYFPNGMSSAGTAYDEIRYNKSTNRWEKVVRIGEVDMGGLTWQMLSDGETRRFSVDARYLPTMKVPNSNSDNNIVLCSLYACNTFTNIAAKDKVIMPSIYSNEIISIKDSSYTNVESFKTAMSGVMLYYELAEPIITEIEDPGFSYQVWNGGVEQIVASNSAPFKADITYNFSANEWIKQNRFDIEKLNTSLGTHYGVCNNGAHVTNKTVTVSGNFLLVTGAQVVVKFTNGNTVDTGTLNVNNTGDKNIITGYGKSFNIDAGCILTFDYDGTSWNVISSNAMLTSGNMSKGYTLQTINSQTSGLAIAKDVGVTPNVDGDLYIAHGGTNENAIYCTAGNIVTETGAVKGNIVHNTRTITATTTLDAKDNIVLCQNTSNIDVNIDTSKMTSGQVITLIKETPNQVTVRTKNGSGASVSYLKTFGSSVATSSGEALSAVGIWNIYCIGSYIYLYKL